MRCRACHSEDIFLFLNLGPMPLVNKLLSKIDEPETYYPLNVVKCNRCHLVQLDYSVDPEAMFKDYTYTPSSSRTMLAHFKVLVDMTLKECLSSKPFVIEIASNDGSLL